MFTVTISTADGKSITSDDAGWLVLRVCTWLGFTPTRPLGRRDKELVDTLSLALRQNRLKDAGHVADELGLNFAFAVPNDSDRHDYYVPVDPADATICESCE
jgi:hypothetical protein